MATALKYHPGSLIKESHLFPAHVCFECSQPLFDPTVRHFLVPHDIKVLAGMKCALLATHTVDGTLTAGLYCPARVRRSYLIEIGNPSKEWVLYHNLNRVGFEDIQVEHGDFFVLYEKVPRKSWSPPSLDKVTSEIVPTLQGTIDHRLSSCPPRRVLRHASDCSFRHQPLSLTPAIKVPLLMIKYGLLHNFSWVVYWVPLFS